MANKIIPSENQNYENYETENERKTTKIQEIAGRKIESQDES